MWKKLSALWLLIRRDARVLWHALRHPQSPWWLKVGTVALVVYLIAPVDLIPDVIPFFGVVDDLVLIPLVISWMLKRLPPSVAEEARRRAGVDDR